MALTPEQRTALKNDILANPDALAIYTDGNLTALADLYNAPASPSYWVWRTNVTRADLYHSTSVDGTTWNWTTYKGQNVSEQNAWVQMFMGDEADFSRANLRAGVAAIFSGSAQANAQRDHCLAIGRRIASRLEKVCAAGAGTSVSPSMMTFEGALSFTDLIGI